MPILAIEGNRRIWIDLNPNSKFLGIFFQYGLGVNSIKPKNKFYYFAQKQEYSCGYLLLLVGGYALRNILHCNLWISFCKIYKEYEANAFFEVKKKKGKTNQ